MTTITPFDWRAKVECGTPYSRLVPHLKGSVKRISDNDVRWHMIANRRTRLFDFAMSAQRQWTPGPRTHNPAFRRVHIAPIPDRFYAPPNKVRRNIHIYDLGECDDRRVWQAVSLFCYHERASLMPVLLAEAGYLSIRDLVLFQALCIAPLLPTTVWLHVRACAERDFLSEITGMSIDMVEDTLVRLADVGVIGPLPPPSARAKVINQGIKIRPLSIYNAVLEAIPEDEMAPVWLSETALLLATHSKEIASLDFKE
ncbi:MAG: hypothetical protein EBR82_63265, partial [Caulobacteraceae bacterium]|nr:hypothetical protein [Caulobacteraceae bacterium]